MAEQIRRAGEDLGLESVLAAFLDVLRNVVGVKRLAGDAVDRGQCGLENRRIGLHGPGLERHDAVIERHQKVVPPLDPVEVRHRRVGQQHQPIALLLEAPENRLHLWNRIENVRRCPS